MIYVKICKHDRGNNDVLGQKYQKHADYKTVATSHKINVKSLLSFHSHS